MLSISLTGCQYPATVVLFYTAFGAVHMIWASLLTIFMCLDVPHMLVYRKHNKTGSWHPQELQIFMAMIWGPHLRKVSVSNQVEFDGSIFFTGGCNSNH